MKTQIPIYRAKKKYKDEWIEGSLLEIQSCQYIVIDIGNETCLSFEDGDFTIDDYDILNRVDPSTLAIHFPDMKDSEGTKIFASLSKDGKGGDTLSVKEPYRRSQTHEGDNVPMGSYTEPLEPEIKSYESPVVICKGEVCLLEDIQDEYIIPLHSRLYKQDIENIKSGLSGGFPLDWSHDEDSDKNYIMEAYNLKDDEDLINFCKPIVTGIQQ